MQNFKKIKYVIHKLKTIYESAAIGDWISITEEEYTARGRLPSLTHGQNNYFLLKGGYKCIMDDALIAFYTSGSIWLVDTKGTDGTYFEYAEKNKISLSSPYGAAAAIQGLSTTKIQW